MQQAPKPAPPEGAGDPGRPATMWQTVLAAGTLVLSALLAWGASSIPSEAGYAGVGPNFLPFVVAAALAVCGAFLLWEARTGGFRELEVPAEGHRADWRALAWVVAGILATATLIAPIGFVLANTTCFVLAVRGLRLAEGRAGGGARQLLVDALTGMAIALPAFWLFTKLLAINLPALAPGGWI